jgi:membrane protease YdiL (CAAX protease family)
MLLGLIMPATVAVVTVLTSKNKALKDDFKRKLVRFYRIKPLSLLFAIIVFILIAVISIFISLLFGGSINQLSFTEDFSFSIGGASSLLVILLASIIEEVGWRGYGEDAVGSYHNWFTESLIFGCIWATWHLPLFWINGTYHCGLREMGPIYMINFLVSTIPFDFIQTWVYVKNRRSMIATIIFHIFVNITQEKLAMTPETKIIQTFVVIAASVIIVLTNRDMFFETRHVGRLLESQED